MIYVRNPPVVADGLHKWSKQDRLDAWEFYNVWGKNILKETPCKGVRRTSNLLKKSWSCLLFSYAESVWVLTYIDFFEIEQEPDNTEAFAIIRLHIHFFMFDIFDIFD